MKKFKDDHRRLLALLKLNAASRGLRIKDLARENGLSPSALYNPFYFPFPKGERIVAGILGLEPQQLWPSRYDSTGRPNRGRYKDNTEKKDVNQKKLGEGNCDQPK